MTSVLADADAPGTHREHVVEMNGHRGYYREGWHAVTLHHGLTSFTDETWELYDLEADPTELHDLAAEHPEKLARAHRGVGGRGLGEPDLPARRGRERQVRDPARARRRLRAAGAHPAWHADAGAVAVGAADLVPAASR